MATAFDGQDVIDLIAPVSEQLREALHQIHSLELHGSGIGHRRHDRQRFAGLFAYLQVSGPTQRKPQTYRIIPLDLSSNGIGFIHGSFAYPGTACAVILQAPGSDEHFKVNGSITRCQLITGRIHSIGVKFDEEIDASPFSRPPAKPHVQPAEDPQTTPQTPAPAPSATASPAADTPQADAA